MAYQFQLGEEQRQQLLPLGEDWEQLWDDPACPITLKKRVLRTVLKEIVATEAGDPPQIVLKLHWAGGVHTELALRKELAWAAQPRELTRGDRSGTRTCTGL